MCEYDNWVIRFQRRPWQHSMRKSVALSGCEYIAPPHTARTTLHLLKPLFLGDFGWPPRSPDLTPTEVGILNVKGLYQQTNSS